MGAYAKASDAKLLFLEALLALKHFGLFSVELWRKFCKLNRKFHIIHHFQQGYSQQ